MPDRETRSTSGAQAGASIVSIGSAKPALTAAQREALQGDAAAVQLARSLRRQVIGEGIFNEPAWEILLALYVADNRRRLNTTRVTELSGVAMTTALRWLEFLDRAELILQRESVQDQRVNIVELSSKGRRLMDEYFLQLRQLPPLSANDDHRYGSSGVDEK
jgi:DNA-binding MarR family transcriptional regulator